MSDEEEEDVVGARLKGKYRLYKPGDEVLLFLANKPKPWCSLSNLAVVPVTYEGITYPSVEHAFQAQKFSRRTRGLFSTQGVYGNPHDNFHEGWTKYHNTLTPRGDNAKKVEKSKTGQHSKEKKDTMGVLATMVNTLTKPTKSRPKPYTEALGLELNQEWDFNDAHEDLWLALLRSKYQDPGMRTLLLSTGDSYLIEFQKTEKMWEGKTKTDRDLIKFYSAYYDGNCKHCNDSNCNAMGKFLMKIRDELRGPPRRWASVHVGPLSKRRTASSGGTRKRRR